MKLVVNKCYGGFDLSARAVARIAEIEGRPCYFFNRLAGADLYTLTPTTLNKIETAEKYRYSFNWSAYDIPDISILPNQREWKSMSDQEQRASNELWSIHSLESRYSYDKRSTPSLVQAVEELGGCCRIGGLASLRVVTIPDDVEFEIDDYDGIESIHEVHRSW